MGRVLVVDDEKLLREALARGLETFDYQCATAESAEEAADVLKREEFDVVLLDINMPGKSGMDLLPQITTRYPDVAVIMLSGFDELSTAVWCMGEGAHDYIDKPVSLPELAIRVEKAMSPARLSVKAAAGQLGSVVEGSRAG